MSDCREEGEVFTHYVLWPLSHLLIDIHDMAVRNGLSPSIIQRRKNYDSNNVQPFTVASRICIIVMALPASLQTTTRQ